ncbi:hypothetical protein [Salininema proteolyticum]|uniref:SH3 domain-containing protein n=1 Tax=Salininema proteolyticum TaxID=1607685 RepID=A0ABV8TYR8_9ACTN
MKPVKRLWTGVTTGVQRVWRQKVVKRLVIAGAAVAAVILLAQEASMVAAGPAPSEERNAGPPAAAIAAETADLSNGEAAFAVAGGADTATDGASGEAESTGSARRIRAKHALYDEDLQEQLAIGCKYRVQAAFGASIFSDTKMSAKRIVRLSQDTEVAGSCSAVEGGKALSCAGLTLENTWIRVRSGTTVGWTPSSCLVRQ